MDYKEITENAEVIELLKQRKEIEDKIRKIDETALINYELKLLNIPILSLHFLNFKLLIKERKRGIRLPYTRGIKSVNNESPLSFLL